MSSLVIIKGLWIDGNIEHQTSAFDFDTLMRSEDIEIELLEKPIEQVEVNDKILHDCCARLF
jgi:hypothetical protein